MRITKREAVEFLEELEDAGIFTEEVENKLSDIRMCISDDLEFGLDTYGGDENELFCLYTSVMDPYSSNGLEKLGIDVEAAKKRYDEHFSKCEEVMKKYAKGREEE